MSARAARKVLADARAMEEEAERVNPIVGSGATPSMGLSQKRGGGKMKKAKMAEEASEAMEQGAHLGKHLHSLHGGAYHHDFVKGMMRSGGAQTGAYEGEGDLHGGFWGALASMAVPLISSLFGKGHMSKEAHDELMACMKGKGKMEMLGADPRTWGPGNQPKKAMKGAGAMSRMVGAGDLHITHEASDDEMEGAGPISDLGIPIVSNLAGMFGLGTGAGTGGRKKKAKRAVAEHDGRRKRAEVVRRVMRERGVKMIEASKIVKAEGLY